ncbi:phytosulfokines 6 [Olea europaea subsp. europaea]|uniref:Phytosulfokine n=2 Tax=Olea europaea subsp. europaea TaxID=158383 RepID=A0A8S0PKC2_OLEEU|nr:phytosulfokines 6 [Olea europaea subsp. europaea]
MEHKFQFLALIFLLATSHSSAQILAVEQGEADSQLNNVVRSSTSHVSKENTDSFHKLMGLEEYGNEDEDEDEECLKRRITAEAHLDYIYTQHRKP